MSREKLPKVEWLPKDRFCQHCGHVKKIMFNTVSLVLDEHGDIQQMLNLDAVVYDVCENCKKVSTFSYL